MKTQDVWLERRHERRYVLDPAEAQPLLEVVARYLQPEQYATSRTKTTYFDTTDRELYQRKPKSTRVRLREYGDGATFVELKYTNGSGRVKLRLPLETSFEATWSRIVDTAPAQVALSDRVRAGQLTPCLRTEYRRQCFRSVGGNLRVTLDTELVIDSPSGDRRIPFGSRPVLEVKYRFGVPAWLQHELDGLVEAPAFSKFSWGCAALERHQDAR